MIPEQEGWIWEGINRGKGEKKGGGIGCIRKENTEGEIMKRCKEHMWCKIKTTKGEILIGMVYLATGNNTETENWNKGIVECMQKDVLELIKEVGGKSLPMVIGGDFNAHIVELGGNEDRNGEMLKQLCERNDLSIGNLLPSCEGKTTWQRGTLSSTIDYILMNEEAKKLVKKIEIDEEGAWSGGSDHNRIVITLMVSDTTEQTETQEVLGGQEKDIWNLEEEKLIKFGQEMEIKIQDEREKGKKSLMSFW